MQGENHVHTSCESTMKMTTSTPLQYLSQVERNFGWPVGDRRSGEQTGRNVQGSGYAPAISQILSVMFPLRTFRTLNPTVGTTSSLHLDPGESRI
jgi:hypothetical protein